MLEHIAEAEYVTFDLEMSGIASGRDRYVKKHLRCDTQDYSAPAQLNSFSKVGLQTLVTLPYIKD